MAWHCMVRAGPFVRAVERCQVGTRQALRPRLECRPAVATPRCHHEHHRPPPRALQPTNDGRLLLRLELLRCLSSHAVERGKEEVHKRRLERGADDGRQAAGRKGEKDREAVVWVERGQGCVERVG